MSEWRTIDSAPKDGTPILATADAREYPCIICWEHVGRYTSSPKMWVGHKHGPMEDGFTHWMPLPLPPGARP
jgi:hypothetical protein